MLWVLAVLEQRDEVSGHSLRCWTITVRYNIHELASCEQEPERGDTLRKQRSGKAERQSVLHLLAEGKQEGNDELCQS